MSHKKGMWYLDDVILYLMTSLTDIIILGCNCKGAPNFQNNGVLITTKIFSSKNHYPNFLKITTKNFSSKNHYPNF